MNRFSCNYIFDRLVKKLLFFAVLAALASCDEHVIPVDWSDREGNIYCTDGSIVPYSTLDDSGKVPAGVVVKVGSETDGFQALVIALEDIGQYAYADSLYNIANVTTDITSFDGKHNTATLLVEGVKEAAFNPQAAMAAAGYSASGITGWHLPSVAELKAANKAGVQNILKQLGEPFRQDWYISSTVDGTGVGTAINYNYCVSMTEGRVVSSFKTEAHVVRPFLLIK